MHSLRFTIFLLILLFLPFFLRKWGLQPYPAVLLPEGADSMSKTAGVVEFDCIEFDGLNAEKKWIQLSPAYVLSPIKVQNFESIFSSQFDSTYEQNKGYKWLKKHNLLKVGQYPHSADKWFIAKLKGLHMYPYVMRIVHLTIKLNLAAHQQINKASHEEIVQLRP